MDSKDGLSPTITELGDRNKTMLPGFYCSSHPCKVFLVKILWGNLRVPPLLVYSRFVPSKWHPRRRGTLPLQFSSRTFRPFGLLCTVRKEGPFIRLSSTFFGSSLKLLLSFPQNCILDEKTNKRTERSSSFYGSIEVSG